ncbi:MAG: CRISPR-associated endonuclease Cas1 [Polyangiales bacterium]
MRPGRPLVISDPMLLVRRDNERLVMLRERTEVAASPRRELSHVAAHGPVTFTGAALAGLLDEGIDVTPHASSGRLRGVISSAQSKNVYLLLAQVDAWQRPAKRAELARALLAGKIAGQRQLAQRQALDRGSLRCEEAARRLAVFERQVWEQPDVDAARGIEGAASAAYFDVFGEMLSEGWRFPGRVRRPATDPVNAMLSFGYAIAGGEVARALLHRGFDARIGLIHGLRYGRESLVLDIVEEFRAPMVDRFTLRLLNRGQFKVEDFETQLRRFRAPGQEARRRYLELWEEMLSERARALRNETAIADEGVLPRRTHRRPRRRRRRRRPADPRGGADGGAHELAPPHRAAGAAPVALPHEERALRPADREPQGWARGARARGAPRRARTPANQALEGFSTGRRTREGLEKALTRASAGCLVHPFRGSGWPIRPVSDNRFSTRGSEGEELRRVARG